MRERIFNDHERGHAAVSARYYGCTREHCCECGEETGRAGATEDSLYTEEGEGPYCEECWKAVQP